MPNIYTDIIVLIGLSPLAFLALLGLSKIIRLPVSIQRGLGKAFYVSGVIALLMGAYIGLSPKNIEAYIVNGSSIDQEVHIDKKTYCLPAKSYVHQSWRFASEININGDQLNNKAKWIINVGNETVGTKMTLDYVEPNPNLSSYSLDNQPRYRAEKANEVWEHYGAQIIYYEDNHKPHIEANSLQYIRDPNSSPKGFVNLASKEWIKPISSLSEGTCP